MRGRQEEKGRGQVGRGRWRKRTSLSGGGTEIEEEKEERRGWGLVGGRLGRGWVRVGWWLRGRTHRRGFTVSEV